MGELLKRLLERSELEGGDVLGRAEVRSWPAIEFERLVNLKILCDAGRAEQIEYDGCDLRCTIAAEFQPQRGTGKSVCVHRCAHGCGRVTLGAEDFDRWRLDVAGLARAVGAAVGAAGEVIDVVRDRVVSAGFVIRDGDSRELFVAVGLSLPDANAVVTRARRLLESSDPVVLVAGRVPPRTIWPDGMRPAIVALSEHLQIGVRGLVLDLSAAMAQGTIPHPRSKSPKWLTNKQATELYRKEFPALKAVTAKANVSRACSEGKLRTNGKKGNLLRIDAVSVHTWIDKLRHADLANEDLQHLGRKKGRQRVSRGWGGLSADRP